LNSFLTCAELSFVLVEVTKVPKIGSSSTQLNYSIFMFIGLGPSDERSDKAVQLMYRNLICSSAELYSFVDRYRSLKEDETLAFAST